MRSRTYRVSISVQVLFNLHTRSIYNQGSRLLMSSYLMAKTKTEHGGYNALLLNLLHHGLRFHLTDSDNSIHVSL